MYKCKREFRRHKYYSISEVFEAFVQQHQLDGMNVGNRKIIVFYSKGTKCYICGLEATFFAKESQINNTNVDKNGNPVFHLNLYGVKNGKYGPYDVLFTQDYVISSCQNGSNDLDNLRTCCAECNNRKGFRANMKLGKKKDFIDNVLERDQTSKRR